MRLEQLVLFGPSDNFTIQFGPQVTVLAGLSDDERSGMLATLVDAMAGRVPNASVIFVDRAGRRVFADRTGATYADTGIAAPSLSELLGTDPDVIADLVTLRADDLGLGRVRPADEIEAELTALRAAHEQHRAQHAETTGFLIEVAAWEQELAELDERIDRAPDEAARWHWTELRNELDHLRAELAALDREGEGGDDGTDARLLDAVEELRNAGETWAESSTIATELAEQLGPLPPVSESDLARVAATPDALPPDFDDRLEALEAAHRAVSELEAELAAAQQPPDPGDGIVYQLARIDQEALWAAHQAAIEAQATYEHLTDRGPDDGDAEVEHSIESAHHEVVRCRREAERRSRAGALGSGVLAIGGLLVGQQVSIVVGIVLLAAAVGLGWWLIVIPRRGLAQAERAEAGALEHADADSWLGLHLRRIDAVMAPDRTGLGAALDRRTSTRLAWEDLSGATSLEAATERRDAIVAHAAAIDPATRAAQEAAAADALAAAREHEATARGALSIGLEGYGLAADGAADLGPSQIRGVLQQRAAAGRFARQALELQHQLATATTSGAILDRLLRDLGFDDGDLAGRLERAIGSVEAARRRRGESTATRSRADVEAEIARLTAEVDRGRRLSWDLTPDPAGPPEGRDTLLARRREVALELAERRRPDLAGLERRMGVADERIRTLEAELASIAEGPGSVRRRLADRIARTTWIGPNEETLPILIDDALVAVEAEELFKLLDMIVRLSSTTQIVLLSGDPTIAKWARREAAHGVITLLQTDGADIY